MGWLVPYAESTVNSPNKLQNGFSLGDLVVLHGDTLLKHMNKLEIIISSI